MMFLHTHTVAVKPLRRQHLPSESIGSDSGQAVEGCSQRFAQALESVEEANSSQDMGRVRTLPSALFEPSSRFELLKQLLKYPIACFMRSKRARNSESTEKSKRTDATPKPVSRPANSVINFRKMGHQLETLYSCVEYTLAE
jgi:hypothetical protein